MTTLSPHRPDPIIRDLTKEEVSRDLDAFLAIGADVSEEYWGEEHFLRDLPEKWRLSFGVWQDGTPVGYAILSRKSSARVHLHHIMVAAACRGRALGTRMLREVERRAWRHGARELTLKVAAQNDRAARFYESSGYRETGCEGSYLLLGKRL